VIHGFILDRSYPVNEPGQSRLAQVAQQCRITFVNNHKCPPCCCPTGPRRARRTWESDPDSGRAGHPPHLSANAESNPAAKEFTTAMILKELAHQLIADEATRIQVNWQAAVGSCLDVPPEPAASGDGSSPSSIRTGPARRRAR